MKINVIKTEIIKVEADSFQATDLEDNTAYNLLQT